MASGTVRTSSGAPGLVLRGTTLSYLGRDGRPAAGGTGVEAARPGRRGVLARRCATRYAWHALKLTFVTALVMVVINAVTGTATAWVLVRYDFPGEGWSMP